MKPSPKASLVKDESTGTVLAVFAKADYTAEHEAELRDIYGLLGCDPESFEGIDSYSVKQDSIGRATSHLSLFEANYSWRETAGEGMRQGKLRKGRALCLRLDSYGPYEVADRSHWRRAEDTELSVCWSWSGLEIMAYGDEAKQFVRDLHSSLHAGDFACFRGGASGNPFSRGGLTVTIPSRLPQEIKDRMLDTHLERKRLLEAADRTGIKSRLDAKRGRDFTSGYNYYALSPSWADKVRNRSNDRGGPVSTGHEVIFWLNPGSGKAKAGWYTVEELDQWISEGTGPVVGDSETSDTRVPGR